MIELTCLWWQPSAPVCKWTWLIWTTSGTILVNAPSWVKTTSNEVPPRPGSQQVKAPSPLRLDTYSRKCRCAMSLCLYMWTSALLCLWATRTPSTMEAWFSASEKIATVLSVLPFLLETTLVSAVKTAMLAANPVGHSRHSWPRKEPPQD